METDNWAALPTSQIQDAAEIVFGRQLSESEVKGFYCHIENDLNEAIHNVVMTGMGTFIEEGDDK